MTLPLQNYELIKQSFAVGGINLKTAVTSLEDNETPYCTNMTYGNVFGIQSRKGYSRITTTTGPVTGIYQLKRSNGTSYTFQTSGTNIYSVVGSVSASIFTPITSGAFFDFSTLNDYAFLVNGVDTNLKYNGTNFYALGLPTPTGVVGLTGLVAGSIPAGVYQYRYVFVNLDGEESNPSPAFTVTIPAGPDQNIQLSAISTSPAPFVGSQQIVSRRLYRTEVGGTTFYRVDTGVSLNDNVTTTYTDSALDSELGIELEFDNDAPAVLSMIETHKDRLFGVDPNFPSNLLFSKQYRHDQWPILNSIPVGLDDGDVITALVSFFDQLVIFKRKSIYVLSGDQNINFSLQKTQTDDRIGALNNRVPAVIGNKLFFLSERGVYSFDGLRINYESTKIEPFFDNQSLGSQVSFNWSQEQYACAINYKNAAKNWYFLCVPSQSNPENNFVVVYDTVIQAWTFFTGIYGNSLAIIEQNGRPFLWSGDQGGRLWKQDDTDSDGYTHVAALTTGPNTASTLTDTALAVRIAASTATGAATITDAAFGGVALNQYVNYQIYISSGAGIGQVRTITANTASPVTFTVAPAWTIVPAPGDQYILGGLPVNQLDGVRVKIVDGLGEGQIRTISTNTPIQITVTSNWNTTPNATSRYSIGFIEKEWNSKWINYNNPNNYKRLVFEQFNLARENGPLSNLEVTTAFDFSEVAAETIFTSLVSLYGNGALWDVALWDVALWQTIQYFNARVRMQSGHIHMYAKLKLYNDVGGERVTVNSITLQYQVKGIR